MQLKVLPLAWGDIQNVPLEQKTLYLSLCFLVGELNTLQRLALLSFQTFPDQPVFEAAARIQSNTLIRVISGKCIEVRTFIESCVERTRDSEVRSLCEKYVQKIDGLQAAKGRYISEHVRRKTAFHLDFREALKSTRMASDPIDCNAYIHSSDGNCFFPAGEHVVFEAGLMQADAAAKHSISSESDHSDWVDWTTSMISLVKDMHADAFEAFIYPSVDRRLGPSSTVQVPENLIALREIDYLPLFYGVEK